VVEESPAVSESVWWSWQLFAASAGVGPGMDVPVALVLLTIPVTLALANLVAAAPRLDGCPDPAGADPARRLAAATVPDRPLGRVRGLQAPGGGLDGPCGQHHHGGDACIIDRGRSAALQ